MEKQINLYNKEYNNRLEKKILYITIAVLAILLWFNGCKSSGEQVEPKQKVIVPAVTNTLQTVTKIKNVPIEIPKWYRDTKTEKKYLKDISEMEEKIIAYQEEIDNMQTEFMWGDSIKQAELYRLATELKSFETELEDEYLKLKINGIIAGNEVKEITPTYTIKERKIDVAQKQVIFRMLVGGGLGINKELNQGTWKINTGFQNKKGNIIEATFQKIGNEEYYLIGYDFSLFKKTK